MIEPESNGALYWYLMHDRVSRNCLSIDGYQLTEQNVERTHLRPQIHLQSSGQQVITLP